MKKKFEILWFLTIIVIATFLQLFALGSHIKSGILLTNTLDLSWQTDSIERLLHGFVAGRDYIFTYGPLFQILYSIPALVFHQTSYISVLYAPILLITINIILLYLTLKLATREIQISLILTAFLFFVIGLVTYDQNSLFRILIPFFYGMLLYRFLSIKQNFSLKTISILLLPTIFGMYTFDLFILSFLTTILFICYEFYTIYTNKQTKKQLKRYLFVAFSYVLCIILSAVLVSIVLSGNLNYLIYSFDTVTNYQFVMSIPWSANKNYILLLFPFGLCITLMYLLYKTQLKKDSKIAFIVLSVIALLQLKSTFIRADDGHIIMGSYPSIIIIFTLLYVIIREKSRLIFVIFFLCFYLLVPLKNNYISTISFNNLKNSFILMVANKPFFSVYKLPPEYYYKQKDFKTFETLIKKNPGNVMIYPYDSYLLNIYNQTYNTLALQFYQYANSLVEEKSVEKLHANPPRFIILGIDDKGAVRLDRIPNFSRNPILAKWMLQNYSVDKKTENYLILRFDPNKVKKQKLSNCNVYDITTAEIMRTNIFERFFKSSTYYLDHDTGTRLPYMPNTKKIFIVENFDDATTLQKLFESNINFTKYHVEEKQIKIIKKHPIPGLTKTFEKSFMLQCYSF